MNEADTVLAELASVVAPGAADTRLVATNAKLREEGASYNLRIAELEMKLRDAEASRLEAQRAEAAALSRAAYFEAKLSERDRVIAGMSKSYGNLNRQVGPLREQVRDDKVATASATVRAVDAERAREALEANALKLLARAEDAERRAAEAAKLMTDALDRAADAEKRMDAADIRAMVPFMDAQKRMIKAAKAGRLSEVTSIVENLLQDSMRRWPKKKVRR